MEPSPNKIPKIFESDTQLHESCKPADTQFHENSTQFRSFD
jgi:hypothetical protein